MPSRTLLAGLVALAVAAVPGGCLLPRSQDETSGAGNGGQSGSSAAGGQSGTDLTTSGNAGASQPPDSNSPQALMVAAGTYESCAVVEGGRGYCWGYNLFGQLGNNSMRDSASPVLVELAGLKALALGLTHVCALLEDGSITMWGTYATSPPSQGDGSSTPSPPTSDTYLQTVFASNSMAVGELPAAVSVASGLDHACALLETGTVWCWGLNVEGELGDGTTEAQAEPVPVIGLRDVAQISSLGWHTCAVLSDGTARCWGYNAGGQLGNNSRVDSSQPVAVQGLSGRVVKISAGMSHSCALLDDGTVSCWGSNYFGQIGNGAFGTGDERPRALVPERVTALSRVRDLSAGGDFTCAALEDDSVSCWGQNRYGECGDVGLGEKVPNPTRVDGLGGPVAAGGALSAGVFHACAVMQNGAVRCWGSNSYGELGSGAISSPMSPVHVALPLD